MSEKQGGRERIYVINLSRVYWGRKSNRAARAIRFIRDWIARRTHAKEVVLEEDLNKYIWSRGIEKPPRKVKVSAVFEGRVEEKEVERGKEKRKVIVSVERVRVGLYKEGQGQAGGGSEESF